VEFCKQENADAVKIRIDLEDTGIGIPEQRIDRLFKPFSQVDSSMSRKFGGTGLGLVISKKICKLMGGDIWVKSKENFGSTFSFTAVLKIPAVGKVENPKSIEVSPPTTTLHTPRNPELKILLAEDNKVNQMVVTRILAKHGYKNITTASDGIQAVEQVAAAFNTKEPFDVVFMVSIAFLKYLTAFRTVKCQCWMELQQQR
jgi:hypothetical protein